MPEHVKLEVGGALAHQKAWKVGEILKSSASVVHGPHSFVSPCLSTTRPLGLHLRLPRFPHVRPSALRWQFDSSHSATTKNGDE